MKTLKILTIIGLSLVIFACKKKSIEPEPEQSQNSSSITDTTSHINDSLVTLIFSYQASETNYTVKRYKNNILLPAIDTIIAKKGDIITLSINQLVLNPVGSGSNFNFCSVQITAPCPIPELGEWWVVAQDNDADNAYVTYTVQ